MLPDRLFARALLARSAGLWLGVRLMFMAALAAARLSPVTAGPVQATIVVAAGSALGFVEARRRNELLLLAELGVSPGTVAVLVCGPVLVLELVATVAVAVAWTRS